MEKDIEEKLRLARAMKRVAARKDYVMCLMSYIVMTAFILIASVLDTGLPDAFFEMSFFIIIICGGVSMLVYTAIHFSEIAFRCTKWEERMLRKFMDEEEQSTNRK